MARRDVRSEILAAAEHIAVESGVGAVTTKEVARLAGCSQGSIYNHFRDRSDLVAQVVANRMATTADTLRGATLDRGATPEAMFRELLGSISAAYSQVIALSTALVADPDVRARFGAVLEERGASPESITDAVASLVAAAQDEGLLRGDADPTAVAAMITGACHQAALHAHLSGTKTPSPDHQTELAHTLGTLLGPT